MSNVRCVECRVDVPSGRWCNRCGAPLMAGPDPALGWRGPSVAQVRAVAILLAGLLLAPLGWSAASRTAEVGGDVALPVAESLQRPTVVGEPYVRRATVICSDMRLVEVPVARVGAAEEGDLIDLGPGVCVVYELPADSRLGGGSQSVVR